MHLQLLWGLRVENKSLVGSCWESSAPPWDSHFFTPITAANRALPAMSGLCPPVPTELVSVFYLKTGSVQQEQECSSLTNYTMCILAFLLDVATADIQPAFLFPTERCEGVDLESVALMKVKFFRAQVCHGTLECKERQTASRSRSLSLIMLKYERFISWFAYLSLTGTNVAAL